MNRPMPEHPLQIIDRLLSEKLETTDQCGSFTDWKERYSVAPWMIPIVPNSQNGLARPSAADAFQIRSVSQERFVQRIGLLNSDQLNQILKAVQLVIGAA